MFHLRKREILSNNNLKGFTIVELLVVIVVIGILAAVTIVAYNGISQKAIVASIQSDLSSTVEQLALFQVDNSSYPASVVTNCATDPDATTKCIKLSGGNTLGVYNVNNSSNPQTFCLTIKNGSSIKKNINQDGVISDGACTYSFPVVLSADTPAPTTNTINLSWPTVLAAESFVLQRATDNGFTTNLTTLTAPASSATIASSTGLTSGTTYYYRMNVTIDGDTSNWSNTASATTQVTLIINAGANGSVNTVVNGSYNLNSTPTITATPNSGYKLDNWSGSAGCSGITTASYVITMNSDKTCTANFIDDPWIQIGTQFWARKSVNIGTRINGTATPANEGATQIVQKYCYNDIESNCTTYGAIYQWGEMMNYSTVEGSQGICPTGAHVPTDNDWKILEVYLGMTQAEADATGYRGADQGNKMRLGGSSGLNLELNSGRNALGVFGGLDSAVWGTSTSSGSSTTTREMIFSTPYYRSYRRFNFFAKSIGYSLRCIKN